MYTSPRPRRRGVSRALLARSRPGGRASGYRRLQLETGLPSPRPWRSTRPRLAPHPPLRHYDARALLGVLRQGHPAGDAATPTPSGDGEDRLDSGRPAIACRHLIGWKAAGEAWCAAGRPRSVVVGGLDVGAPPGGRAPTGGSRRRPRRAGGTSRTVPGRRPSSSPTRAWWGRSGCGGHAPTPRTRGRTCRTRASASAVIGVLRDATGRSSSTAARAWSLAGAARHAGEVRGPVTVA